MKPRYHLRLVDREADQDGMGYLTKRRVSLEGNDLALLLCQVIEYFESARTQYLASQLIVDLFSGEGTSHEFWEGYNQAMDDLVDAADRIYEGWKKHDEQIAAAAAVIRSKKEAAP